MVRRVIKKIKGILFADPQLIFEEERKLIKQPFYFKGTNGKGIILIHGWTSTPYEVRRLGKFLNEKGYTVFGPLLRGHGTRPEDLEKIKWEDWVEDLEKAYLELKKEVLKVYVGGTSTGACLTTLLAQRRKEIAGIVLMAMPFKIKLEKLLILIAHLIKNWKPYNYKIYPPTFGVSTTITRLIAYQKYSVKSALETFALVKNTRENLGKVTQPCFLIQSRSDHVVSRKSLEEIYRRIGSETKSKKYIKMAYHTFISDIKNEHIFEDILNFLEKN
jgi:carboxylesterase